MADSDEVKPKRKANRHSWRKGQSGNPGGRPKSSAELREACRKFTAESVARLGSLINHRSPKVAIAAIRELFDRGYGRPQQALDVALEDARHSTTLERRELTPAEVQRQMAKILAAAEMEMGLVPIPGATPEQRLFRLRQQDSGLPPQLYAALSQLEGGTRH